mmetsp:Transcript_25746/g.4328  ORF Transcript_25746/g.4328 Transcript_25746/m.4328 type:complete len:158 (+) Transcript_25746:1027-1500(+)
MCNMTSVAFLANGKAVSGGTNGMVYLWEDRNCAKAVDVHGRGHAVHTIKVDGNRIFSGGRDNNICELDADLNKVGSPKPVGACPRAIDCKDNNLLVGSRDGKIQEMAGGNCKVLMESHCDGEVWGLAVNPANPDIVVTTGDDNYIRAWNIRERKCIS